MTYGASHSSRHDNRYLSVSSIVVPTGINVKFLRCIATFFDLLTLIPICINVSTISCSWPPTASVMEQWQKRPWAVVDRSWAFFFTQIRGFDSSYK